MGDNMKFSIANIVPLIVLMLGFGILCPESLDAARRAPAGQEQMRHVPDRPPATEGQRVKTEYFNLILPRGWIMPYPVNNKPDGTSAVFADEKTQITVTVNIIRAKLQALDFANMILPNMKKSGLKPEKPVFDNGFYKVVIRGKASGAAWFGSNGNLCTATVILSQSPNVTPANELLSALKTTQANLFPKKVK